MCAILKVYFVLYKLSGCAAFQLKYFRSYDREIEFSPKNHPPPIWRGRVGDGRYFPHSYRSEIFWGFLNIYFQIPCAPAKRSDEMMLVGPTLTHNSPSPYPDFINRYRGNRAHGSAAPSAPKGRAVGGTSFEAGRTVNQVHRQRNRATQLRIFSPKLHDGVENVH